MVYYSLVSKSRLYADPLSASFRRTYIVFAVFCVAMTIHVYFMFPEVSNRFF